MIGQDSTPLRCTGQVRSLLREAIQSCSNYLLINTQESKDLTPEPFKRLLDVERQLAMADPANVTADMITCNLMKAAIHYHYKRIEKLLQGDLNQQRQLMLKIIHGDYVDDAQLDQSLAADRLI